MSQEAKIEATLAGSAIPAPVNPGPNSDSQAKIDTGYTTMGTGRQANSNTRPIASSIGHTVNSSSDRYQTMGQLGRGGWGVVEQAMDRQLQRPVAIKRMAAENTVSDELRERFLYEARITSQLQHPGIVPVHELSDGQAEADTFYVMKLLTGASFRQAIKSAHDSFSDSKSKNSHSLNATILPLLERFIDVCEAVGYAHEQSIIHRDLKPDNIMVGGFGETIVVDWGLAKKLSQDDDTIDEATLNFHLDRASDLVDEALSIGRSASKTDRTQAGSVIGTPAYMSPEQSRGEIELLGPATDIYSLGAILYEILTGKHPHAGCNLEQIMDRVARGIRTPANEASKFVPRPLSAICDKAMAVDIPARYATAIELANEIRNFIAGAQVTAYQESTIEKFFRWCRRHRSWAAAGVVFAVSMSIVSTIAGVAIYRAHRSEMLAHQKTEIAYREAVDRLEQSRQAADTWFIDLSGSLQFYPGLDPLRDELLKRAIGHYQNILASQLALPASRSEIPNRNSAIQLQLQLERARVQLRLADLFRLSDQMGKAIDDYGRAHKAFTMLLAETPTDHPQYDAIQLELTNAIVGLALSHQNLDKEIAQNAGWLDKKLSPLLSVKAGQPTSHVVKKWCPWVSCRARLALAIARDQDQSAAPQEVELAVKWAVWLVRNRGSSADESLLQTAMTELATTYETNQQWPQAAQAWKSLVDEASKRHQASPQRIDRIQSLAYSRLCWANCLARQSSGKPASTNPNSATANELAIKQYQRAIAEFKSAWELADADGFYQRNLASTENNLGMLLAKGDSGQQSQARQHFLTSLNIRRSLIRQQPSVEEIRIFCRTISRLVTIEEPENPEATLKLLNDADSGYQLIQDHGRLSVDDRKSWAAILIRRAECHQRAGRSEAATVDRALAKRLNF